MLSFWQIWHFMEIKILFFFCFMSLAIKTELRESKSFIFCEWNGMMGLLHSMSWSQKYLNLKNQKLPFNWVFDPMTFSSQFPLSSQKRKLEWILIETTSCVCTKIFSLKSSFSSQQTKEQTKTLSSKKLPPKTCWEKDFLPFIRFRGVQFFVSLFLINESFSLHLCFWRKKYMKKKEEIFLFLKCNWKFSKRTH